MRKGACGRTSAGALTVEVPQWASPQLPGERRKLEGAFHSPPRWVCRWVWAKVQGLSMQAPITLWRAGVRRVLHRCPQGADQGCDAAIFFPELGVDVPLATPTIRPQVLGYGQRPALVACGCGKFAGRPVVTDDGARSVRRELPPPPMKEKAAIGLV